MSPGLRYCYSDYREAALSAGAFGFVTAILLALTGLPEAEEKPAE